jgi:hypothetical protein
VREAHQVVEALGDAGNGLVDEGGMMGARAFVGVAQHFGHADVEVFGRAQGRAD